MSHRFDVLSELLILKVSTLALRRGLRLNWLHSYKCDALKTLGTLKGRVQRQLLKLPEQVLAKGNDLMQRVGRIHAQKIKDKNKLYIQHTLVVQRISKGKARHLAITLKEGLALGMRSMPGNPDNSYTLVQPVS